MISHRPSAPSSASHVRSWRPSFDSIIVGIQAGNIDVAMSAMYDNNDPPGARWHFVDYAQDGTAMLVLKGNPEGITTFEGLAGKNVGCEKGTTQADPLAESQQTFLNSGASPQ